jgi:hypothetical protein
LDEEEKKWIFFFSLYAGGRLYACVREQAKRRVLAGIVDNETYRERKRLQV